MMHLLGGILAALAALALLIAALRESAYRRGFHEGQKGAFEAGREAGREEAQRKADEWWLNAEAQIDQARQKIWREEG